MKIYLFAALAFVVSLVGSAVVGSMLSSPPEESPPTSVVSDSTQVAATEAAGADSAAPAHEDTTALGHEEPAPEANAATSQPQLAQATPPAQRAEPETAGGAVEDAGDEHAADSTATAVPPSAAPTPVPATPAGPTVDSTAILLEQKARSLARIFAAMRPAEAASVMNHLGDADVVSILRFLNARAAAGVLGQLPESRAAAISRRLLSGCEDCGGSQ